MKRQVNIDTRYNTGIIIALAVLCAVVFAPSQPAVAAESLAVTQPPATQQANKGVLSGILGWVIGSPPEAEADTQEDVGIFKVVSLRCSYGDGSVKLNIPTDTDTITLRNATTNEYETKGEKLQTNGGSGTKSFITLSDGTYAAKATKHSGNSESLLFTVDCDEEEDKKENKANIVDITKRCEGETGSFTATVNHVERLNLYNNSTGNSIVSNQPTTQTTLTHSGLADGTYTFGVTNDVTDGWVEETITFACENDDDGDGGDGTDPGSDALSVSCSVSPKTAEIDQPVDWTASAMGGVGSYRFQWRGDTYSNASTANSRYSTAGEKSATVYVYDEDGERKAARCEMTVDDGGEVKGEKDKEVFYREIEEF